MQIPFRESSEQKAPNVSYRALFSMLRKLYLSPEIKIKD